MLREIDATRSPADADRPVLSGGASGRPGLPAIPVAGPAQVSAQVERLLTQCRRQRGRFAMVCVSVEHVDGPDGPAGAALEQRVRDEVAHRIQGRIRASDRLLRDSHRDSTVLLPGGGDIAAERVAERFVRALNGVYRVEGVLARARVRIGSALHPLHGTQTGELMRRAAERL
jgi:GGDEF domain-containing protein